LNSNIGHKKARGFSPGFSLMNTDLKTHTAPAFSLLVLALSLWRAIAQVGEAAVLLKAAVLIA
jgi:hypothetical protein